MVETAGATGDSGAEPVPHATLDELVAEPKRVADAADAAPVRIERSDGAPLVLMSAATFERLNDPGRTRALHVSELTDADLERLRAQAIPAEAAEFDHEGDFVGHG